MISKQSGLDCSASSELSSNHHNSAENQPISSASISSHFGKYYQYYLITLMTLLSHGFILTNDGTFWDSWYYLNLLETRNWDTLSNFFSSLGMPIYAWFYWPFAYMPNIVTCFMLFTFLSLLADGILTYQLAVRLGRLTNSEAVALALLVQAMPLFSAAQDFCMFFYVFTHTLFLLAARLAVIAFESHGWRHTVFRSIAVLGFFISFTNAALLVFYGCVYLLFFFRFRQQLNLPVVPSVRKFLIRYPDLFVLPLLTWVVRSRFTPQHGWYENHNLPGAHLKSLLTNLLSFFQNTLPYHFRHLITWPGEHPIVSVFLVVTVLFCGLMAPRKWYVKHGSLANVHLIWFGIVSIFMGIFPFAAAGKWFSSNPISADSRFCILAGLPLAILLLALLRFLLLRSSVTSRWLLPVTCCLAVMLSSQITPVYLNERVEWIFSRALLHRAVKNDTVRNSSVILLQGFNVIMNDANGLYGFASAFGSLTRLVTHNSPENGQYFTPQEMEKLLMVTTFPPNDFRRIDPSGMQIYLAAERNRGAATDWEIVTKYLKLRYFGGNGELDRYLASLVSINTFVLKPAIPLETLPATQSAQRNSVAGKPGADFANGAGMSMVRLPGGWWAARYETTQAQYAEIMGNNPSLFKDPLRPVDSVSWHEAVEFCKRVTALEAKAGRLPTGFVYRLPTAQEFDIMAADALPGNAVTSNGKIRWHSEPVGTMQPNNLGLHDVIGNVWEWCLEWGDAPHRMKISKGGSWANHAETRLPQTGDPVYDRTIIDRLYKPVRKDYPDQRFWNRGFRCILAPSVSQWL